MQNKVLLYIPGEPIAKVREHGTQVIIKALSRESRYEAKHHGGLNNAIRHNFKKFCETSVNPELDISNYRKVLYIGDCDKTISRKNVTQLCDVKTWYQINKKKGRPSKLMSVYKNTIKTCFEAIQYVKGTTEHQIDTKLHVIYSMPQLRDLARKIKQQGFVVVDTETMPETKGVDPKDWLHHNTSFWLSKMRMLLMSPLIGEGWAMPMSGPESWFNVGKEDYLVDVVSAVSQAPTYVTEGDLIRLEEDHKLKWFDTVERLSHSDCKDFYIYRNGHILTDYMGTPQIFTQEQAHAWLENTQECADKGWGNMLEDVVIPYLNEQIFQNPDVRKIYHNYAFDYKILKKYGIEHAGIVEDTMVMCHALSKNKPKGLKPNAEYYWTDLLGWAAEIDYVLSPFNVLAEYGVKDLDATLRLYHTKLLQLYKKPSVFYSYYNASLPTVYWLSELSYYGEQISLPKLKSAMSETKEKLEVLEGQLRSSQVFQYYNTMRRKDYIEDAISLLDEIYNRKKEEKILELTTKISQFPQNKQHLKSYTNLIAKVAWLEGESFDETSPHSYKFAIKYVADRTALLMGEVDEVLIRSESGSIKKVDLDFNFRSPDQIGDLLYLSDHGLQFPVVIKGSYKDVYDPNKGKKVKQWVEEETTPSQAKVLWWRQDKYFATDTVEEHRNICGAALDSSGFVADLMLYKTILYYLTKMEEIEMQVDSVGRIHSRFPLVGTDRTSSQAPNLQNIPQRSWVFDSKHYRNLLLGIFEAPEGYVRGKCDLGQAEIRVFAQVYWITQIADNIEAGKDLHIIAAKTCLGISEEDWDTLPKDRKKHYRNIGKIINFSLLYGARAEAMIDYARDNFKIILNKDEAEAIRTRFLTELYTQIPAAHKKEEEKAMRLGYCETAFGTRRELDNVNSKVKRLVRADIRKAINTPIQGTAGIYTCYAGVRFRMRKEVFALKGNVVNIIHDDLPCIIPVDEMEFFAEVLANTLIDPILEPYFGFTFNLVSMDADFEHSEPGGSWATITESLQVTKW